MRPEGRHVRRRDFLRTGAAAGAALAGGFPARRAIAQGKGKVRFAYLQLGWAACEIIHKEDLLGKRGWQAEYNVDRRAPGSPASTSFGSGQRRRDRHVLRAGRQDVRGQRASQGHGRGHRGARRHRRAERRRAQPRWRTSRAARMAAIVGTLDLLRHPRPDAEGATASICQKDAQIVTATAPPDMVNAAQQEGRRRHLAGNPRPSRSCSADQGELPRQADRSLAARRPAGPRASPSTSATSSTPSSSRRTRAIRSDLNDAQRDAVDIWYKNKPERTIEIVDRGRPSCRGTSCRSRTRRRCACSRPAGRAGRTA